MSEGKHHTVYTAGDIRKYLAGEMDAREMHAMEKAALDDPFLAEAMEGFAGGNNEEVEKQLGLLREHFKRNQHAKIIPISRTRRFSYWKIAAAVLVVCLGLAITYLFTNQRSANEDSLATTTSPAAVGATEERLSRQDSVSATNLAESQALPQKSASPEPLATTSPAPIRDSTFISRPAPTTVREDKDPAGGDYKDEVAAKTQETAAARNEESFALNRQAKNAPSESEAKRSVAAQARGLEERANRTFSARVLSADNKPLPYANVKVPDERIDTYADVKGNFKLVSPDSLLDVEVRSAGYITRTHTLKSNDKPEKIFLVPENLSVGERTAVSRKTSPRTGQPILLQTDTLMDARPLDGWNNYNLYLLNNLNLPREVVQQQVHGEVIVSFTVLNAGTLANFRIEKSLCRLCDEEVMRLIKQGPPWKVMKGNNPTARLTIKL
jgi:outer membrane biosynthesis protein TonB